MTPAPTALPAARGIFLRGSWSSRCLRCVDNSRYRCRPKVKRLGHDNKQPLNPQLFFSSSCLSLSQFRGEEAEGLLTRFWDALTGPTPGGSRSRLTLRFVHCPPAAAAPAVPTRSPQRNGPQFALIFGERGKYILRVHKKTLSTNICFGNFIFAMNLSMLKFSTQVVGLRSSA